MLSARYEAGEGENFSDEVKEQQLNDKTAVVEKMKDELEQLQKEVVSLQKEKLKACQIIKSMIQSRNEQNREILKLNDSIAEKVNVKGFQKMISILNKCFQLQSICYKVLKSDLLYLKMLNPG